MMQKKAVVLLSGGIDSATTLAIAVDEGYTCYALTFNYGQRHLRELISAKDLANYYELPKHVIIKLDLQKISTSALLDPSADIPENRPIEELSERIPPTYVPARNIIMLSHALAWAESLEAEAIFIGINSIDYSGYPDCRPEFIKTFEHAASLGTKTGAEGNAIKIKYPLVNMTKAEIIKRGFELKVPYKFTWSCYKGGAKACGVCDSCILRLKGFEEAGYSDVIEYE